MILELQLAAEKLRQVLLAQVRARPSCFPDRFSILGSTFVIDRLEFSDKSTIRGVTKSTSVRVPGVAPGTPATVATFNGRLVEYVQPMTVFAVDLTTLGTNGQNASANSFAEDTLRFLLTLQVTAGVPQLRFRLDSVDQSVTAPVIMSKASIDVAMDMDLSSIQGMLGGGGGPVVATNAGMTIDGAGARVVMRIELNEVADTQAAWRDFFQKPTVDLLGTNDWSLLVDKDLIVPLALAKVAEGLAGATGFALVSGPSASWMSADPAVYVTLEGDALKACTCFGVGINVRALVVITVGLSVPPSTTDVLRLTTWMGFIPDGAAIFCCTLTQALFWAHLGGAIFGEGEINWLGFILSVFFPVGVYIGATVVAYNQTPPITLGGACRKLSDSEFECDQPLQISAGPDFRFTLASIAANAGGPLFEGTMRTLAPAAVPLLTVDRVEPFAWRLGGSCHAGFGPECRAYIRLRGARTVCKAEILDDPRQCYSAAIEKNPLDPSWLMPHITLTPDVDKLHAPMQAPYPCRVLLWTDGGARLIEIATPQPITAAETAALDTAGQRARIRCLTDSSVFWEGTRRFNRKWLVDPPPETYSVQVWEILVTGLTPVEQVVAEDVAGNVVATALPSAVGMVHLSAHFVSEAEEEAEDAESAATVSDEVALALQQTASYRLMRSSAREASPSGSEEQEQDPERERDPSRQLVIKQVLLVRESTYLPGGRVRHLSAARMRNVPVLVTVTATGVRVLEVSDGQRPRVVQTILGRGIRGAAVWNDRLLVWGDDGMAVVPARQSQVGLPTPWLRAPVMDATTVGGQLAVLSAEGISLHSADLSCAAHVPAEGGASLLAAGPRLLVGEGNAVEAFDLSRPGAPRREAVHALPACSLYAAPPTNDARSVVFSRSGRGGGRLLALDDGQVRELVRYARDPWFHRTARVGNIVARLDRNAAVVTVLRIAGTYEA